MPQITKLVQGVKNPERVNVSIDGKYVFSLSAEEVIKHGFKLGTTLSSDEIDKLSSLSESEKLFSRIINFISYRPRSEKEVIDRLYKYLGPEEKDIKESLLSKLKKLGYIDDLAFAKWFTESRRLNRPRSIRQLASELYLKGISKDIIESVLRETNDDKEAIRSLIEKKKHLSKDKLVGYLARKGFSWELIKDELSSIQLS